MTVPMCDAAGQGPVSAYGRYGRFSAPHCDAGRESCWPNCAFPRCTVPPDIRRKPHAAGEGAFPGLPVLQDSHLPRGPSVVRGGPTGVLRRPRPLAQIAAARSSGASRGRRGGGGAARQPQAAPAERLWVVRPPPRPAAISQRLCAAAGAFRCNPHVRGLGSSLPNSSGSLFQQCVHGTAFSNSEQYWAKKALYLS